MGEPDYEEEDRLWLEVERLYDQFTEKKTDENWQRYLAAKRKYDEHIDGNDGSETLL